MPKNNWFTTAVAVVLALGVGFGGGMWFQSNRTKTNLANQFGNRTGQVGQNFQPSNSAGRTGQNGEAAQQRFAQNMIRGQIVEVGDGTLTVQLAGQDSTQVILFGADTTISQFATADSNALITGESVMISGQESNGVISAQSIQVGVPLEQLNQ